MRTPRAQLLCLCVAAAAASGSPWERQFRLCVRVDKMAKIAKTHEGKRPRPFPRASWAASLPRPALLAFGDLARPFWSRPSPRGGAWLGSSAQAAARVMASSRTPGPALCSALAAGVSQLPCPDPRASLERRALDVPRGGGAGRRTWEGSRCRPHGRRGWQFAAGKPRVAAAAFRLLHTESAPTQARCSDLGGAGVSRRPGCVVVVLGTQ